MIVQRYFIQCLTTMLVISHVSCHIGRLTFVKDTNLTQIACQGETTNIMCGGYEGIRVNDAFWGRDNEVDCQSDDPLSYLTHKATCKPLDLDYAYRKVSEICQDRSVCVIAGTPLFFDTELCPNVRKYVRVKYECREMSGMKKSLIDVATGERKSLIDGANSTSTPNNTNATKEKLHDSGLKKSAEKLEKGMKKSLIGNQDFKLKPHGDKIKNNFTNNSMKNFKINHKLAKSNTRKNQKKSVNTRKHIYAKQHKRKLDKKKKHM